MELRLRVGGTTLNVERLPRNGPPLVLWHGLVRRWQDFAPLLPALTGRWSVTAVDHRGHGKSDQTPGQYFVPDYIRDAVAVVRGLIEEPAVLYGHSLGALTAMGVAAECPELVRAVVLEDPPSTSFLARIEGTNYAITWRAMRDLAGRTDVRETSAGLAAIRFADGRTLGQLRDAASLRFLARCLADLDPGVFDAPLGGNWLGDYSLVEVARRVKCPALLLASDPAAGGMLPLDDAAELTTAFADGLRIDFPGRGHLLHGEHPAAVLTALHPFLESL